MFICGIVSSPTPAVHFFVKVRARGPGVGGNNSDRDFFRLRMVIVRHFFIYICLETLCVDSDEQSNIRFVRIFCLLKREKSYGPFCAGFASWAAFGAAL